MSYFKPLQPVRQKIGALCLLTLLICFALPSSLFAQMSQNTGNAHSLILSENYTEHYLSPYLTQYEDSEENIKAEDVLSGLFVTGKISQNSGSIVTLDTKGTSTWLSFDVVNRSKTTRWKIDFGNGAMGRFGLFDSVEGYVYNLYGNTLEKQEFEKDGSLKLDLVEDQKSQVIIHLKYKKGLPTTTPIRILRYSEELASRSSIALSFFTASLIGMAFFFAAIAIIRSQYKYLYFSLYYVFLNLLMLTQNTFVTANGHVAGSAIIPFLFLIVAISSLMIARIFWNIDEKIKTFDIAFLSLIGFSILVFLAGLLIPIDAPSGKYTLYYGPSLLIFTLIPLLSIIQSQRGQSEVTAFMFGWFIFLFGLCITMLSLHGYMPSVSTAINAFWYTLIPQAIFFVFAIKAKLGMTHDNLTLSRTLDIEEETETVSRLRQSKENTEQERLLKVIEQERKVLGELRKSEARRTDEMRVAKDEADKANKDKSAFLAVVSHEIRTPMTGIMGMVRLLLESNLTKEQKEYTQTIQDSSDAMLALLNDILDFEKIEQGQMTLETISFDLHRLLNGVATLMKGHAAQKNILFNTKIGTNLPKYVYGDPTRLRQVLLNLTGNAVKFTNEGHVTLTAELMREKDDNSEIYFGVTDSGVGIPKAAQEDLFNPFSQADTSISRKFGGTGLGLAISRGLVQGMDSDININSNEGEGSTFFFTLNMPIGNNDNHAIMNTPTKTQSGIKPQKILVVDDNQVNQKVIEGFLKTTPHNLTMIDDAQTAISRLEKETFDIILMDIEMPGLKGDVATKHIRQSGDKKIKNIPIIALTGNVRQQDIEKYYAAGMNGYISKPIDVDLLKSTINKAGQNIFDNQHHGAPLPSKAQPEKPVEEKGETKATEAPSTAPPQDSKILKSETLDTLKGHLKTEDIKQMLDEVITKNDEIIQAMNEALSEDKKSDLSARGHEMKGMAGNFGLIEISEQAAKIEARAKTDATIVLAGLLDPLPEMQKRAKEALNQWLDSNKD